MMVLSQICDPSVPQILVDLSDSPTGEFIIDGANLSGSCCENENLPGNAINCIEFIVIPHPNSISFSFSLQGPIVNGNLHLNCEELLPLNEQFCVLGGNSFSLIFCRPGNPPISTFIISSYGLPEYNFEDITIEQTCVAEITSPNFSIKSIFPGNEGDYNYLLSCVENCDETFINLPLLDEYVEFIDFEIISIYDQSEFGCDGFDLENFIIADTIRVNIIPKIELEIISECDDFSYLITGGVEPYTFVLNDEIVNDITPVEGLNTLIVQSFLCSSDTVQFEWFESRPTIEVFYDSVICLGEDVFFTTFSEDTLIWNFGDGSEFIGAGNITHQYASIGNFNITVSYLNSSVCDSVTEFSIIVNEKPLINADVFPNEGCVPLNINLFSEFNPAYTYTWDFGFTTSTLNEFLFTLNEPSNYTIDHIVSNHDCVSDTSFFITVYEIPVSNFTIFPDIVNEDELYLINVENNSQFGNSYLWDFGEFSTTTFEPQIEEMEPGNYLISLTVTNDFGCSDISYGRLIIKPLFTFYVPNAFTPNNDGVNDLFFGEGTGIKNYEMSIYNRWGERIFYSQDKNDKWNGGVTDWYVQNDVYQYVFKITDVLGKIHLIKGHVTVIR